MDQLRASNAAYVALHAANVAILNSTPGKMPSWAITSKPYLKAITFNDYGVEDPTMCVLYALNNMQGWKGEMARRVKAELNAAIKEDLAK